MAGSPIEIRAGLASALVDPANGGMLAALSIDGRALLAPPSEESHHPFPTWGSFLMAPWVGHLAEAVLRFRGVEHHLPPNWGPHAVHGLVARGPWVVDGHDGSSVRMHRRLDPPWPFGGLVRQAIAIDEAGIDLRAGIEAGDEPMPAALGWHPWFRRPDTGDMAIGISARGLLEHDGELPTGRVADADAHTDLSATPFLADRRIDIVYVGVGSPAVMRTADVELSISFDPLIDTVVVYTPSEAVCVEPWSSWPDAHRLAAAGLSTGLVELDSGQAMQRWTRWSWSVGKG